MSFIEAKSDFTEIGEKISFAKYLLLLRRATSEDQSSVPGYLFAEIEAISFQSPEHCQQLCEYLNKRLGKPAATVKLKVLKLMLHLVNNGPASFRQYFRMNDGKVKLAVMFNAEPDPFLGTAVNEDVRKHAQELLNILFDVELMQNDESGGQQLSPLAKPHLTGLGVSKHFSGKYEGFGSTPVNREVTLRDRVFSLLEKLTLPSNEHDKIIRAAFEDSVNNYEPANIEYQVKEGKTIELPSPLHYKAHIPGLAGGGWESEEELTPALPTHKSHEASIRRNVEDSEEVKLIEHFCSSETPPSLTKLREISRKCSNYKLVIQSIKNILQDRVTDKERLTKALLIVEWLLRADSNPLCDYDSLSTDIEYLMDHHPDYCIRIKSQKVLCTINKLKELLDPVKRI